ncbi:hypothetical protein D3C77_512320 [compost metagenome]
MRELLTISELNAKPIVGYPGYYITQDGKVYSVRSSRTGEAKLLKVQAKERVTLYRSKHDYKQIAIKTLVNKAWGLEYDGSRSN